MSAGEDISGCTTDPRTSRRWHLCGTRDGLVRLIGILTAQSTLVLGLLLLPDHNGRGAVTLLFLLAAPAMSVFVPLRGVDPLARTVLAGTAALVVNAGVAEVMLATGTWSVTWGVLAVALISMVMAIAGCTLRLRIRAHSGPAPQGTTR